MNISIVREDKNARGHLAMIVVNIIFGLNMVVSKMAMSNGSIDSLALMTYRMTGAAILFWVISIFIKREKVARKDLLLMFFASLFGIILNQGFFLAGLSLTSPVNASIIASMVPILTMVLAALFLREPITWKKTLGVIIGAGGAIMLILTAQHAVGASSGRIGGDIFCLMSATSYALYLTLFRDLIRRYSPVTLMKWLFLFAAVCTFPFGRHAFTAEALAAHSSTAIAEVLFVVVGATFLAYLLIPVGQKTLRPTIVSMYNYMQPLVATVTAVILGMDRFGPEKVFAAVLVFAGVLIATMSKSRAQMEREDATEQETA